MMYHLGVLSSISCLRTGYEELHGNSERDEDHYKLATIHMDYVLSSIEKFNIYHTLTDFLSKYRMFPFVALSSGFVLDHDALIRANVSA